MTGEQGKTFTDADVDHGKVRQAAAKVGERLEAERVTRIETRDGHPNLASALSAFQMEMPVVAKASTANIPGKDGRSGYSYTYADLADIAAAVFPLLTKHGLSFSCLPRRTDGGYELAGRLCHNSGEHIEGALPIHGRQAQEIGSSLTYGRRYLLGCMTGVVTDDDDDGSIAQAARDRADVDRGPAAAELLARVLNTAEFDQVKGLWHEAYAAGLLATVVEHMNGDREPLGDAIKRHGDALQTAGA